jgi:hypothetical protein
LAGEWRVGGLEPGRISIGNKEPRTRLSMEISAKRGNPFNRKIDSAAIGED